MSEAVQLAAIAVVASLLTGTVVVAVGVWADGRRKRSDASVALQAADQTELVKVRMEYRDEIKALREEIRSLRDRLDSKERENRDLSITVARQEARIGDLEDDLARLHKERERAQANRIETVANKIDERLRVGEIGSGEKAVVDKAQANEIQAATGEAVDRLRREGIGDEQ